MDWFAGFVDETVTAYLGLNQEAKVAAYRETVERARAAEDFTAEFIGFVGEWSGEQVLQKMGYATRRTRGSKSPADVWGIRDLGGLIHVALLQFKTARKPNAPAALDRKEQGELETFGEFVWGSFNDSGTVPAAVKGRPRVISAAYVGATLDVAGVGVVGYRTEDLGFVRSRGLPPEPARGAVQQLLAAFVPQA